jgi:hypothetical protein
LVPSASSIRSVLIRLPIRSSIHIWNPPAPGSRTRGPCTGASPRLDPGHALHDLPGRAEHLAVLTEEARVVVGDLLGHRDRGQLALFDQPGQQLGVVITS